MKIENPYHEGELKVQERLGVLSEGENNAKVIHDSIVKGALRYIGQQPMAVLGSLDHEQNVWASVFGATEEAEQSGFDLIKDNPVPGTPGLASLRKLAAEGSTILTF